MKPPQIFIYIVSLLLVSFANGVSAQTPQTPVVSISYEGDPPLEGDTPSLFESVVIGRTVERNIIMNTLDDAKIVFTVTLSRALLVGERIDVPLNISTSTSFTLDDISTPTIVINSTSTGVRLENTNSLMPTIIFEGAGAQVANLVTTVINDNILEEDETITFMLGSGDAFQRSPDASAFEVTLLDDEYTLCFSEKAYSIREDEGTATIPIIRSRPINRDITVRFSFLTPDNFSPAQVATGFSEIGFGNDPLNIASDDPLSIASDTTRTSLEVVLEPNDKKQEFDKMNNIIRVPYLENTLCPGRSQKAPEQGSIIFDRGHSDSTLITIVDTGATISNIVAGDPVSEGTTASFTISVNAPLVRKELTVDLRVSEPAGSNFVMDSIENTTQSVVIGVGQTMATLLIPTVDNEMIDVLQSSIRAEIISTVDNREIAAISETSAEVTIYDNDITAFIESSGDAITEGSMASFIVSLDVAPTIPVTVNLRVSESAGSNFLGLDSEETTSVVIRAGQTMATLAIPTVEDSEDEPDGSVTVTFIEPTSQDIYRVDQESESASIDINDNDTTVSIQSLEDAIIEGDEASFTVSLAIPPTAPVEVNLSVSESGNFLGLDSEETTSVVIAEGQTTATLVIRDCLMIPTTNPRV